MGVVEISIINLGRMDALELQSSLKGQGALRESTSLGADKQGDLATLDLVLQFAPPLIGVLGLYLSKSRRGRNYERTLRVTDASGVVREERVYFDEFASDSPTSTIAKTLSSLFGISEQDVVKEITQAQNAEAPAQA